MLRTVGNISALGMVFQWDFSWCNLAFFNHCEGGFKGTNPRVISLGISLHFLIWACWYIFLWACQLVWLVLCRPEISLGKEFSIVFNHSEMCFKGTDPRVYIVGYFLLISVGLTNMWICEVSNVNISLLWGYTYLSSRSWDSFIVCLYSSNAWFGECSSVNVLCSEVILWWVIFS